MKEVAKVLNAFIRHVPVVPHPREVLLYVAAGLERGHQLNNMKIGDLLDVVVGRLREILLGDDNALLEEVRVHGQAVLFGKKHAFDN